MSASVLSPSIKISQIYCTRDLTTETAVECWSLRQRLRPNYAACIRTCCLLSGPRGARSSPGGVRRNPVVRISVFVHRHRGENQKKRSSSWNLGFCHNFSLEFKSEDQKKSVFVAKSKSLSWRSLVFRPKTKPYSSLGGTGPVTLFLGAYFSLGWHKQWFRGTRTQNAPPWRRACIQYLNCREDSSPHRDLASPDRDSACPHRNLSVPPSRLSNFYTKRKIPGHLNEKVEGNGNYYKTPAEVSTNLRRRLFFGLHLILVANSWNSVLRTFFYFSFFLLFGLQPDCCRTPTASRLDCASVHPCNILQFKCCLYPTPNKKQLKL